MKIQQTYRIYPNTEQQKVINQWLGNARYLWNYMLNQNIEQYKANKTFNSEYGMHSLIPNLKKELDWLKLSPSQTLQQKCQDLRRALPNSVNKAINRGFPKFKAKHKDTSGIRFPQGWHLNGNRLNLPKLKGIKIKLHREIEGKARYLTLKRDSVGSYFVSILYDVPNIEPIEIKSSVGIDVGLKEFAVMSDGEIIKNPKFYRKAEKKLTKAQRSHSRKQKGSNNKEKSRILLAKVHRSIKWKRQNFIKQIASSIAKNYDLVTTETLNIKGMLKNHKLAKSISDVGWSMFIGELKWQCKKRGKHFNQVDRWFPSTKTCSSCGKKQDMTLSDREYNCDCGIQIDRDLNAAININRAGTVQINACRNMSTGSELNSGNLTLLG